MSNAYLCPILQQNQFTDNANFLAGGLIWFYQAGTTTPAAAYTTPDASVAWPNPIVLDQRGETGGEIWLSASQAYKIVLEEKPLAGEAHGIVVSTFDNIYGVNDVTQSVAFNNWVLYSGTVTRISATSFSVSGDKTSTFQAHRRIKSINGSGSLYSTIESSTYASNVTTVVLINDTTGLEPDLSAIYYSAIETTPSSIPKAVFTGTPTTASAHEIYIDYISSKLNISIDNGSTTNVWPINVNGDTGDFSTSLQVNNVDVWTNTNNPATLAASGSTNLQNGLQIRWGTFTASSGGSTISFSSAFTVGAYAVTISDTNADTKVTGVSSTHFVATSATGSTGYYIAIGH